MALICDTGPLYAAIDRSDADHEACASLLETSSEPLLVPAPVVVELDWLVGNRLGHGPFVAFLDDAVDRAVEIVELDRPDYRRARDLLVDYADMNLGFVDAAVIAIVERFREPKLATLDHRHFAAIRPAHVESLTLLPE